MDEKFSSYTIDENERFVPESQTRYFQIKASNKSRTVKNVNTTLRYQYRERRCEFFKIYFMMK